MTVVEIAGKEVPRHGNLSRKTPGRKELASTICGSSSLSGQLVPSWSLRLQWLLAQASILLSKAFYWARNTFIQNHNLSKIKQKRAVIQTKRRRRQGGKEAQFLYLLALPPILCALVGSLTTGEGRGGVLLLRLQLQVDALHGAPR